MALNGRSSPENGVKSSLGPVTDFPLEGLITNKRTQDNAYLVFLFAFLFIGSIVSWNVFSLMASSPAVDLRIRQGRWTQENVQL